MLMCRNIVIGKPLVPIEELLAYDKKDWETLESRVTYFTQTRYLPAVLKEAGITSSASEIRRNRPDLCITLDTPTCFDLKIGGKKLYVVVGE